MVSIAVTAVNNTTLIDAQADNTLLGKTNSIIQRLSSFDIDSLAKQIASRMVTSINTQNRRVMADRFKAAYQIDISSLLGDQVVSSTLNKAIDYNVSLISSIKNDFISDIGKAIRDNYTDGMRSSELAKIIKERGKVSDSRAKMIARDQTAKINGTITRERNKSLGIEMYIWLGADDERERDSHRAMNNKLCRFDDATVYSDDGGKTWKKRTANMVKLHPCEDYQCRCDYQPYISWLNEPA
ncbi:phage head morphogenesis protein [Entomomonas asaccharolytica]|uniref:Minor capsid protein n=1 Tax=Entomomonas asaccharolytica TaxID=2785331 RepID=A0A974NHY8_9GAMM|nr:phage minor head protein [Entomomonas asaccharolytica]QQP86935.1 minor capsid protein [Entomomonas asaccharolytica]